MKCFSKIKVDSIYTLLRIKTSCYKFQEGQQVCDTRVAFAKTVLRFFNQTKLLQS